MSLPARQQRVIDNMEGALRASEPGLASMFSTFAQLNDGEPIEAEPLPRRRRWLTPGDAMYAVILIPVMSIMILLSAMLSSGARGAGTCEAGDFSPALPAQFVIPAGREQELSLVPPPGTTTGATYGVC
jgi:hypothetical protein